MNLTHFGGRSLRQAQAYMEKRTDAWRKLDNDRYFALDEAPLRNQIQISGEDGSQLQATSMYVGGGHGYRIEEMETHRDGSGSLYFGYDELREGTLITRHQDGTFEGYQVRAEVPEATVPQIPSSVAALFGPEAPQKPDPEPVLTLSPISAEAAESSWADRATAFGEWKTRPLPELYDSRS